MRDSEIRDRWREAGGTFHGPRVEHGNMEERALLRFLGGLYDQISELKSTLSECASGLECEIEARYADTKDHPAMKRRYERDMEPVSRACALVAGKTAETGVGNQGGG